MGVGTPRSGGVPLLFFITALAACAPPARSAPVAPIHAPTPSKPPPSPAPAEAQIDREVSSRLEKSVEFDEWRSMAGGATYLTPQGGFVGSDGGVDVIVAFNAGQLADKEWRKSGVNAVLVSASYGQFGTQAYRDTFADPNRFAMMMADVVQRVHATHVRRLALVSWSAGYAATDVILHEARYYAMVDTIVLLDGLHADYLYDSVGAPHVDENRLSAFVQFARDAVDGRKTLVVIHSSIVPPNYASTTETAAVLCDSVGAERVPDDQTNDRAMTLLYRVDVGKFHVRGYKGIDPKDHMNQLFIVGDVAREHIAKRWAREDVVLRLAAPHGNFALTR